MLLRRVVLRHKHPALLLPYGAMRVSFPCRPLKAELHFPSLFRKLKTMAPLPLSNKQKLRGYLDNRKETDKFFLTVFVSMERDPPHPLFRDDAKERLAGL